jgi:hypothetical protein
MQWCALKRTPVNGAAVTENRFQGPTKHQNASTHHQDKKLGCTLIAKDAEDTCVSDCLPDNRARHRDQAGARTCCAKCHHSGNGWPKTMSILLPHATLNKCFRCTKSSHTPLLDRGSFVMRLMSFFLMVTVLLMGACRSRVGGNDVATSPSSAPTCPTEAQKKCQSLDGQTQCRMFPMPREQGKLIPACFYPVSTSGTRLVFSYNLDMYIEMPIPGPAPMAPVDNPYSGEMTCSALREKIGCDAYCQTDWQICWKDESADEAACRTACAAGK